MFRKHKLTLCIILVLICPARSFAFTDGSGWVQVGYLSKILLENYERYKQLQRMFNQAKEQKQFFEAIHKGLENTSGLLSELPIKDEGILKELRTFNQSLGKIADLYGKVPQSPEAALHMLHDQTVAESFRMINDFKDYAKKQEDNSNILQDQSRQASPKGAARMAAEGNAMVLKGVSQLIRLETQNLKMQSEILALKNKRDKEAVKSYQKLNRDFGTAFSSLKPTSKLLKL